MGQSLRSMTDQRLFNSDTTISIRGEAYRLRMSIPCFKLLDEVIHSLLDEQLRGVVALRGALLAG